jgi:UDP:flavonoid glycosyltransferase YjiC (YdhE family)
MAALLLVCIPRASSLKALFVTIGAAGHVTPMFELAKAMKDHQVTFLTHRFAQSYVDLDGHASPSFRIVYANNSAEAFADGKAREQLLLSYAANQSFFDATDQVVPILGEIILSLVNETAHVLAVENFDVVVAGGMIFAVPHLCEKVRTPCVLQKAAALTDPFDFNFPNPFSLLKPEDLTQLQYRIYNVLFSIRVIAKVLPRLVPAAYKLFQSLPQLPKPFADTLSMSNLFFSKPKSLSLISVPLSFLPPTYPHPYTKFLGSFVDETTGNVRESDLTRWIASKSVDSIVYGAFGSSSLISHERMSTLIEGLAKFLMQSNDSSALLAFRSDNYATYLAVLNGIKDDHLKDLLNSSPRVRIEPGFVPQKWILQQPSIHVFISHCGMGSALESLYFSKPILCMPFNMEQFSNALTIVNLDVGLSLFVSPSL